MPQDTKKQDRKFPGERSAWHALHMLTVFTGLLLACGLLYMAQALLNIARVLLQPLLHLRLWLRYFLWPSLAALFAGPLGRLRALDSRLKIRLRLAAVVGLCLLLAIALCQRQAPAELLEAEVAMLLGSLLAYVLIEWPLVWVVEAEVLAGGLLLWLLARRGAAVPDWPLCLFAYAGSMALCGFLAHRAALQMQSLFLRQSQRIEQLERLCAQDPLTGLANRRKLDHILGSHYLPPTLAVMLIDIDRFKDYNRHYGHQKGDDCLRAVAAIVARYVRRPDDVAVRLRGDEFVLLLPGLEEGDAIRQAEALLLEIRAANIAQAPDAGQSLLCMSIGLAFAPRLARGGAGVLLAQADSALLSAKGDGGDCYRLARPGAPAVAWAV